MENFENNARRVRQKNFYLLHLDAPRIIIIMTVMIGIIAGAFLLGMNLELNDNKKDLALKKKNLIIDEHKELGMLNDIPDLHDDEISTKNIPEDEDLTIGNLTKKETPKVTKRELDEPSEVATNKDEIDKNLMGKNVQVVSTKTLSKKKNPSKISKNKHRSTKKNIVNTKKPDKHRNSKRNRKNPTEKKNDKVVEVVAHAKNFRSQNNGSPHFAIQIASYDKKGKAISEMNSLKNKHFKAYVNKSKINGKNFYRVRVGPFKSKRNAADLLNEIQNFQRYEDSYMVKE